MKREEVERRGRGRKRKGKGKGCKSRYRYRFRCNRVESVRVANEKRTKSRERNPVSSSGLPHQVIHRETFL